jgi:hypothetical protein
MKFRPKKIILLKKIINFMKLSNGKMIKIPQFLKSKMKMSHPEKKAFIKITNSKNMNKTRIKKLDKTIALELKINKIIRMTRKKFTLILRK